jgi:hypothetical protein
MQRRADDTAAAELCRVQRGCVTSREALARHSSTAAAVVDDASRMLLVYRAVSCMSRALHTASLHVLQSLA